MWAVLQEKSKCIHSNNSIANTVLVLNLKLNQKSYVLTNVLKEYMREAISSHRSSHFTVYSYLMMVTFLRTRMPRTIDSVWEFFEGDILVWVHSHLKTCIAQWIETGKNCQPVQSALIGGSEIPSSRPSYKCACSMLYQLIFLNAFCGQPT